MVWYIQLWWKWQKIAYGYGEGGDDDDYDYEKNKIINKKAKVTKKCVIKRRLVFENYKDSLFNDKTIPKITTKI